MTSLLILGPTHTQLFPAFLAFERSVNILGPLTIPHVGAAAGGLDPKSLDVCLCVERLVVNSVECFTVNIDGKMAMNSPHPTPHWNV